MATQFPIYNFPTYGSYGRVIRRSLMTSPNDSVTKNIFDVAVFGVQTPTTYYKMRAIDPDCMSLTYVTWVVEDAPDHDGSQYAGSRCGANPLEDIVVTDTWEV